MTKTVATKKRFKIPKRIKANLFAMIEEVGRCFNQATIHITFQVCCQQVVSEQSRRSQGSPSLRQFQRQNDRVRVLLAVQYRRGIYEVPDRTDKSGKPHGRPFEGRLGTPKKTAPNFSASMHRIMFGQMLYYLQADIQASKSGEMRLTLEETPTVLEAYRLRHHLPRKCKYYNVSPK
ncbi:MAG: hypothetical protein EB059_00430 [Alphaproteobacteria bacterium]|nr:hypothetical protein [Alphaproteobacteria bacterium]